MGYRVNPNVQAVVAPPIAEAQGWVKGLDAADLLDVAQAVPSYPPAESLRTHLAEVVLREDVHGYTDILGLPRLRRALAEHMAADYEADIDPRHVAVTAGCNQAFCLALSALAAAGDEVILPVPYYFNHQMWLDAQGIRAVHLPTDEAAGSVPDPEAARRLITPRTRAIVLVTPSNPTGAVYPPGTLEVFYDLARERGLALVIDETYKDFRADTDPPHGLFRRGDWPDVLVHLYSFSKAYSLTGHRVGSVIAGRSLIEAVAKLMDCVAICPPHLGQEAALYGLERLAEWREDKRRLMVERVTAFRRAFARNEIRYRVVRAGAYFAYVRHPFEGAPAAQVARRLARAHGVLCLPGSMFGPGQDAYLRFAFANLPAEAMPELADRLLASQG